MIPCLRCLHVYNCHDPLLLQCHSLRVHLLMTACPADGEEFEGLTGVCSSPMLMPPQCDKVSKGAISCALESYANSSMSNQTKLVL